MIAERVILVDEHDREIGTEDKQVAHAAAFRHRAVSVFVFNSSGSLLLQRRARTKYHSPGLWSNTCCGHPRPRESALAAARRRLAEEMGLRCRLCPGGAVSYRSAVPGGLWEHEYDHLFLGVTDRVPRANPAEVEGWDWVAPAALTVRLRNTPEVFTPWFPLAGTGVSKWIRTILSTRPAGEPCSTGGARLPSKRLDASTLSALSHWSGLEWPCRAGLRG